MSKREERGAEADECYVFGPDPKRKRRPDVAIEVVRTSGGIVGFLDRPTASQAIRDYVAVLRAKAGR